MARKRNLDTAARPGPRYENEAEIVHGGRFLPKRKPKLRQTAADTRSRLPWRSPNGRSSPSH